jgi:cation:H+ antiporter
MAMGNAVGSIICNSSFILGTLFVLMAPVPIQRRRFLFKGFALFIALAAGLGFAIFPGSADGTFEIGRGAGLALLFLCVVYLVCNYFEVKSEKPLEDEENKSKDVGGSWGKNLLLFFCGAAMVSIGAFLLIDSGQKIAASFGVKESIVSLVFIALGTSLPELITAITAWRKGAHDISVGNIFGANILNIVLVVGTAASINPLRFNDSGLIRIDLPICLGLTTALLLIGGLKAACFRRWVGFMLLASYVAYLASLILLHRVAL